MLDLRQLNYFVAVAEHLSFTRAARALYVGQPSLSAQIQQLERSVGAVLLVRSTRRVELTPAGEALLPRARALLADAEHARQAAREAAGELPVRIDIVYDGCDTGVEVVRQLVEAGHPTSAVEVLAGGGVAAQVGPLRSGVLDVGLGRAHELPDDLEHEVVRCEEPMVFTASGHLADAARVSAGEVGPVWVGAPPRAPEWTDFAVRSWGAAEQPVGANGPFGAIPMLDRNRTYLGLASTVPAFELIGLSTAVVDGWPPYPWSLIWLRARRHEPAVRAVRAAARAAGARRGWLPRRADPSEGLPASP